MNTIITIGRQFGSGGREIGEKVAERYGIKYYDKDLIAHVASNSGFCKEMIEQQDERATNSFLYNLVMDTYSFGYNASSFVDMPISQKVFLAQFETIKKLASEGPCVIVGRCADYVLRDIPEATNIFIYAEPEDRIERAIKEYGIAPDEAKGWVAICDKARANYYNHHTGRRWGEAVNYHMSIDSGYISKENIVKLIEEYMELRK